MSKLDKLWILINKKKKKKKKFGGKNKVAEYYSKKTSPPESRYHSYEPETLVVVNAVNTPNFSNIRL